MRRAPGAARGLPGCRGRPEACASKWRTGAPRGRPILPPGSRGEPMVGYSREVVVGENVFVAGSAPVMPGGADPPAGAYAQTRRCLEIIGDALAQAGAGVAHVARPRL